jgi:hypothetical protein
VNRIRQLFSVKTRDNWNANDVEVWPDEARHGIH